MNQKYRSQTSQAIKFPIAMLNMTRVGVANPTPLAVDCHEILLLSSTTHTHTQR